MPVTGGPCLLLEPTLAGKEEAWLNPGRRGAKHAGSGLPPGPGGPLNTPARQGLVPTGRDQPRNDEHGMGRVGTATFRAELNYSPAENVNTEPGSD